MVRRFKTHGEKFFFFFTLPSKNIGGSNLPPFDYGPALVTLGTESGRSNTITFEARLIGLLSGSLMLHAFGALGCCEVQPLKAFP